jgi:AcrR family transcriptional regulator
MAGMQIPASIEAAWGAREPATKGPRPSLSLERIVAAGIAVADREGLEGVSMAKVAAELGSAAMSLYRYVATKDELLLLMVDGALGLPPETVTGARNWRSGLEAWGRGICERYLSHAWSVRVPISGPPLTPNNIAWLEAALAAVAGTGLEEDEKLSCVLLISGYARSQALLISDMARGIGGAPVEEDPAAGYWTILRGLAPAERFPHLQAVITHQEDEESRRQVPRWVRTPGGDLGVAAIRALQAEIDFGLQRILDGIDKLIQGRS